MIKAFKETLDAEVSVEIIDRPSKELLKLLEKKEIDLALLAISPDQALNTSLTSYHLMENELCLILNLSLIHISPPARCAMYSFFRNYPPAMMIASGVTCRLRFSELNSFLD